MRQIKVYTFRNQKKKKKIRIYVGMDKTEISAYLAPAITNIWMQTFMQNYICCQINPKNEWKYNANIAEYICIFVFKFWELRQYKLFCQK